VLKLCSITKSLSENFLKTLSKLYVYASLSKDVDGKIPFTLPKLLELQTLGAELVGAPRGLVQSLKLFRAKS
jgi:hypothetical protein